MLWSIFKGCRNSRVWWLIQGMNMKEKYLTKSIYIKLFDWQTLKNVRGFAIFFCKSSSDFRPSKISVNYVYRYWEHMEIKLYIKKSSTFIVIKNTRH